MYLTTAGGYGQGAFLIDLTGPGAQVSPTMFVGDTAWTITTVLSLANVATASRWFGVGNNFGIRLQTDQTTAGNVCAIWANSSGGGERGTCSNGSVVANNTFYSITVTKTPGAILGGASGTVRIYINGTEISAYNVYTYGAGTPSGSPLTVDSGPMYVGSGVGHGGGITGTFAAFGVWSRTLAPAEIADMYKAQKAQMKRRGITLP
jgi:hypothetical protein